MKNVFFALATLSLLAGCGAADETGPVPLAKHFMAEFYDVNPDAVNVKTINEKPQLIAVLAQVAEHACRMEMSPAPKGVSARFGWLVSSMQCDDALAAKQAAEPAPSVNIIPAGAVVDCLPFPSIETLKTQTVYENGKPAFGGVVTCSVIDGQSVPRQARFVGQLVAGPVPNSFSFAWEVLQLPGNAGSIKWNSADGELLSFIQTDDERLQLTFNRALRVTPASN